MSIKEQFLDSLKSTGSLRSHAGLENLVSENLISPYVVELPKEVLKQAENLVAGLYGLRSTAEYAQYYAEDLQRLGLPDPGNKGIAMSYDVHWNADQKKIQLIEINTNAAFLFLSVPMYSAFQLPFPVQSFKPKELIQCCENEIRLSALKNSRTLSSTKKIAVIDDHPEQQKLFVEFLYVQNFLQFHGWDCEILDYRNVTPSNFDLIYNRHTDFFFKDESSRHLRESYQQGTSTFSPNPFEYFLLADKQRLIDWQEEKFFHFSSEFQKYRPLIEKYVPKTQALEGQDLDKVWIERKNYFFKPKNSFGSKLSYRGSSISRKTFESLPHKELLRQEYVPPPEITFQSPEGPQTLKCDLRLYAYEGRLQSMVARLYQGQMTNLQTKNGGFAPVRWISEAQ